MATFVDLAHAADRVTGLLPGIPDDRLDSPTPCAGTTVGGLLSHLLGLSAAFRAGAEKAPDVGPQPTSGPPPLEPDWRTALPARLDALVAAWREPAAQAGTTSVGGVEMPAAVAAVVAVDELVLHGWDLARATGQPFEADPASIDACLEFVAATARPEGVPGLFGPPVPVPEEAPALHQLLGLSGRDPVWSPPNRPDR
jgi:uncharacterized protein (TIGR03086 family)